jgi:deoxyribonuclease V
MEEKRDERVESLIKRYGIDIENLKREQIKLAREIDLKEEIDFSLADRFGAIDNVFVKNKLLSCIVVCDKDFEVLDRAYSFEKVKFPYIPGFRNYRELVPMTIAYEKLREKPDLFFVPGQGITHQRLGLASHFSLSSGIPSIGVSNSVVGCEFKDRDGADILKNGKRVGKVLICKEGSNPLFVSPGNKISVDRAYDISKKLIVLPHKRPEPLHLASKYSKQVKKELI